MSRRIPLHARISREDWLQHALDTLRREGIQGVRIEKLARELGVTKGGFYGHFRDLDELKANLLEFWSNEYTNIATRHAGLEEDDDPVAALLQLIEMVRERHLARYELAMRSWADHDEDVAAVVRKIHAERIRFLRRLFQRIGFTGAERNMRARLLLNYLSWDQNLMLDNDVGYASRRMPVDVHRLLTAQTTSQ